MIEVIRAGAQATVQDLGRPGFAHLGVPHAGAVDVASLRLANRLVGNSEGAAAIEFLLGGLSVRFAESSVFALTGAPVAPRLDGRPIADGTWSYAHEGQVLDTFAPDFGVRTYLAVGGGITVPPVMGSRSTDTLAGLGPPPIRPGDRLPTGTISHPASYPSVANALTPGQELRLYFTWGPREAWLSRESLGLFTTATWTVTSDMDRVAARLSGPPLEYLKHQQLPTEGLHLGSVQVPPSGELIVHLANHPPTGGYPVIGVVRRTDVARIAQARPGTRLAFRPALRNTAGPPLPFSRWTPTDSADGLRH